MTFTKFEDRGPFTGKRCISYKARTLNDLYLVLSDIRSHEPDVMEAEWHGWDDGSIVIDGAPIEVSIDSTHYDAKEQLK